MGKVIVAGTAFEIDAPVINFRDDPSIDAHREVCLGSSRPCKNGAIPFSPKLLRERTHRYWYRPQLRQYKKRPPLDATLAVVRQFVIHHDGCPTARVCFNVLHNERGLSCHFLIDNDGTILQTLDVAFMGFHAAGLNANSIGVELCNRGNARKHPNYYRGKGGVEKRDERACTVHGHTYWAYDYTAAQYDTFTRLARGLRRILPNLPTEYPQSSPGQQSWGLLERVKSFTGYLGHYHITRQKWDPGPFDFKKFLDGIRGQRSFPIRIKENEEPDVPRDTQALRDATTKLYRASEEKNHGGFFPVGPFGKSRLWHGGIHLSAPREAPVFVPFGGRVVAVRMGGTSAVGSTNFALVRHDMTLGPASVRFYSLYYHLAEEFGREGEKGVPRWLDGDSWAKNKKRGQVSLIDEPIEAGDVVGRIGSAGPADEREPQIHLEIFAAHELMGRLDARDHTVIDGTASGRFADDRTIIDAIDNDPKDGKLSRRELVSFYQGGTDRSLARYYVTLHVSEWIDRPSWSETLKLAPDFADIDPRQIDAMVADQITPGLWWNDKVAEHAKLPRDGVVYHYHPITFVRTINERIIEAEIEASNKKGPSKEDAYAKDAPTDVKDDREDLDGESFVTEDELRVDQDFGENLTLDDLAQGFP